MTEAQRLAHHAVGRALRSGRLVRPEVCERCGKIPTTRGLHAHHYKGYELEHVLDVQWLCGSCHNFVHAGSLGGKAAQARLTDQDRIEIGRHLGRTRVANMTPEQLSAAGRHAREHQTPEERSAVGRKAGLASAAKRTPEERSAIARRASQIRNAKLTPEERSAIQRRAAATAKRRREAREHA